MSNVSVKVGGRYCAAYLVSKAYYWEENLNSCWPLLPNKEASLNVKCFKIL